MPVQPAVEEADEGAVDAGGDQRAHADSVEPVEEQKRHRDGNEQRADVKSDLELRAVQRKAGRNTLDKKVISAILFPYTSVSDRKSLDYRRRMNFHLRGRVAQS